MILLFNKRMIGKYDFEIPDDGRILLNEDGFKKFCKEYERWMNGYCLPFPSASKLPAYDTVPDTAAP